jgi:hypothetical protein
MDLIERALKKQSGIACVSGVLGPGRRVYPSALSCADFVCVDSRWSSEHGMQRPSGSASR